MNSKLLSEVDGEGYLKVMFELERLEALRTAETSFLNTHGSATVSSSSDGNRISRHLAGPSGATATTSGYPDDVTFHFYRRHR